MLISQTWDNSKLQSSPSLFLHPRSPLPLTQHERPVELSGLVDTAVASQKLDLPTNLESVAWVRVEGSQLLPLPPKPKDSGGKEAGRGAEEMLLLIGRICPTQPKVLHSRGVVGSVHQD